MKDLIKTHGKTALVAFLGLLAVKILLLVVMTHASAASANGQPNVNTLPPSYSTEAQYRR